ncbi:MAG: glyoxalase superfamily protein [Alphaproteobacteria bacterium]
MRLTIRFDEPVDVVTCDKFSAFCQRVSCNLNEKYVTAERTGNGQPHMRLER